jgi:hypothetical protein
MAINYNVKVYHISEINLMKKNQYYLIIKLELINLIDTIIYKIHMVLIC